MYDLPVAPLVGAFSSPCKEEAKQKGDQDQQSYFIMEKSVYNSFTGTSNKLMIPCTYTASNGRHSAVAGATKSSAVFSVAGELFMGKAPMYNYQDEKDLSVDVQDVDRDSD